MIWIDEDWNKCKKCGNLMEIEKINESWVMYCKKCKKHKACNSV